MVKEHQVKQQTRKEEIEKKRQEALESATNLTSLLVDHLNEGVAQAYLNQRKLDAEAKQLQTNVTQFSKLAGQWMTLMENMNKAVNELGDLENWSKAIERDMMVISSSLEYAYKVGVSPGSSTTAVSSSSATPQVNSSSAVKVTTSHPLPTSQQKTPSSSRQ
jgi:hypothetical protein